MDNRKGKPDAGIFLYEL